MSRTATRPAQEARQAPSLEVKGSLSGLRVRILDENPDAVATALEGQLRGREAFYRGASVTLEFLEPPIDFALCARLIPILETAGVSVTGAVVYEEPAATEMDMTAGPSGLREQRVNKQDEATADEDLVGRTEHEADAEADEAAFAESATLADADVAASADTEDGADEEADEGSGNRSGIATDQARFVVGPVRGGQRIASAAPIVVFGDVNPGAEVVSGESVIVWGRVRGAVEAGAGPNPEKAVVCALDLAPARLKIGPVLARAPEEPHPNPEPEVACLEDGHIVVKGWR